MNFSKTTLLLILLAIFIIATGFFIFEWWQVRGELAKQIEENENLIIQIDKLQKEIEELKTTEGKVEGVTVTTDKTEYRQEEKVKIVIKNNSDKKIFGWRSGWGQFSESPFCGLRLQRLENGNWVSVQGSLFLCHPCGALLEIPAPFLLGSAQVIEMEWDQVIRWCEDSIEKSQKILGKYRIIRLYKEANCKDPINLSSCWLPEREEWETIYSNEFIIK